MSEEIKLFDINTWSYIKKIRSSNVVNLSWFAPTGAVMYFLTMLFYILLASSFDSDYHRLRDLSWSIFGIHIFVGLLVIRDSIYFAGSSVVLQTAIIGLGTFNTFSLAGILGSVISRDLNDDIFSFAILSLLFACISNGMMVSLLFAMFHKTSDSLNKKPDNM